MDAYVPQCTRVLEIRPMATFLSLLGTLFSNSTNAKGKRGELKTSLLLSMGKNSKDYDIFDDVTLHTADNATTQIDHIVISQFGVFVLEVKNYAGYIYGNVDDYQWTQVLNPTSKFRFYNPILQNQKHVEVVQRLLNVQDNQIFSIVVFMGKATFKTPMPDNVIHLIDLNRKLRSYTEVQFTPQQCQSFANKIHNRRLSPGALANTVHLTHIENKRQSKLSAPTQLLSERREVDINNPSQALEGDHHLTCPKCGSKLVQRTAQKGQYAGKIFYGCSNFPKCRFTINDIQT